MGITTLWRSFSFFLSLIFLMFLIFCFCPRYKRTLRFHYLFLQTIQANRVMQPLGNMENVVPTASDYW